MALSPGQIVNGKYRIIRLLGDGGMGSVYEANHEVLGARVALKLLHTELSRTGVAKRFLQEARASARIKSRHVVGVSDADQTPEGHAFIVLEYLEGKTLREHYDLLARERRTLPFSDALDYAMQMFEGVEAAHAAGIVHRDLKPDNVMITQDNKGAPLLKLLDFGIAKVDEQVDSSSSVGAADTVARSQISASPALTRPGALLGTPEYMAPEQVYSANSADVRSDVFSLGVILFEMLSGRRPVLSDDPQQIAVSYLTGAFTRLEDVVPDLPPGLASAVHHALAAQPRDRFSSVAEMRAAIEPFAPPRPTSMSRTSLIGPAVAPTAPTAPANTPRPIPDTLNYPASQTPPAPGPLPAPPAAGGTQLLRVDDTAAAVTAPANIPRVAPSAPPPAFTPDYPSAMAPFSAVSPAPVVHADAPQPGFVPEYPPPFVPPSGPPSGSVMGSWVPPEPVPLAPPARSKKGLYAGIALAVLLAGSGITLGILYYQGWFDADPAPRPVHKTPPAVRPHPTAVPTHRGGGGQLR